MLALVVACRELIASRLAPSEHRLEYMSHSGRDVERHPATSGLVGRRRSRRKTSRRSDCSEAVNLPLN
jgi:hypothetical protein